MSSILDIFDSLNNDEDLKVKTTKLADSSNPAQDFIDDLVYWLENKRKDLPRSPGLHCSSLWQVCPRVPLLTAQHKTAIVKEPLKAGSIMTFDEGHAIHDIVQNLYLGPSGRLLGDWKCIPCNKIVVTNDYWSETCPNCGKYWRNLDDGSLNIIYIEPTVENKQLCYSGHCDGIITDRSLNKKRVFEFKSISKYGYDSLKKPKHEHVVQVHGYMKALNIFESIIMYWDKASQCDWAKTANGWLAGPPRLKAYYVEFDGDLWNTIESRIIAYNAAETRVRGLPVVTDDDVMKYSRVCAHDGCDMAQACSVKKFCFALPR